MGLDRLEAGGLEIHTTLDVDLNETRRDLMRHRLAMLAACNYETRARPVATTCATPLSWPSIRQTGEVLAMVGSPDYFSGRIDGAVNGTTALRQPGSAIKPLTYAAAFADGGDDACVDDAGRAHRLRHPRGQALRPAQLRSGLPRSGAAARGAGFVVQPGRR